MPQAGLEEEGLSVRTPINPCSSKQTRSVGFHFIEVCGDKAIAAQKLSRVAVVGFVMEL